MKQRILFACLLAVVPLTGCRTQVESRRVGQPQPELLSPKDSLQTTDKTQSAKDLKLKTVEDITKQLRELFKERCPDVEMEIVTRKTPPSKLVPSGMFIFEGDLVAQYKAHHSRELWATRDGHNKRCEVVTWVEEEGFWLHVSVHRVKEPVFVNKPQTDKEKKGIRYRVMYPVPGDEGLYLWADFLYGCKPDAKLIENIKQTIATYAKERK